MRTHGCERSEDSAQPGWVDQLSLYHRLDRDNSNAFDSGFSNRTEAHVTLHETR